MNFCIGIVFTLYTVSFIIADDISLYFPVKTPVQMNASILLVLINIIYTNPEKPAMIAYIYTAGLVALNLIIFNDY